MKRYGLGATTWPQPGGGLGHYTLRENIMANAFLKHPRFCVSVNVKQK